MVGRVDPIPLIDTRNMSEEDWLALRKHGLGKKPGDKGYIPITVGGSDVSKFLGENPWVSTEEARNEKMGVEPVVKTTFNEESKTAGHVFEPFVAINFLRWMKREFPTVKVNIMKDMMIDILPYLSSACPDEDSYKEFLNSQQKVIDGFNKKWPLNPSVCYQHGKYPWALANIDGLVEINGKIGIFEAKTTGTRNKAIQKYWEQGAIPPYYYWQLVFYMAVMNLDFAYITCIWGATLNDMAVIYLERDLKVEDELFEFLEQFIEDMETGLPLEESNSNPELVSEYYSRLFGPVVGEEKDAITLPAYCEKLVKNALALDEQIKEAEAELAKLAEQKVALTNQLHAEMTTHQYGTIEIDGVKYGIKIEMSKKRGTFDEERFLAEQPALAADFTKQVIDTTALGKVNKAMKVAYTVPGEVDATKAPKFKIYEYGT